MNYRHAKIARDIEKVTGEAISPRRIRELADPFYSRTCESLELLRELNLLKGEPHRYELCFQLARVERLAEMEREMGWCFPGGHKEIAKGTKMARSLELLDRAAKARKSTEVSQADGDQIPLTPEQMERLRPAIAFLERLTGKKSPPK
jgi:hypothetical protein